MEVTIEKTKAMKFSGNGRKCKSVFLYNGKPIENVSKYKYLGIEFRSSGSWRSAIANKSNRRTKVLFFTLRLYMFRKYCQFGNFRDNFIFSIIVKGHIYHV